MRFESGGRGCGEKWVESKDFTVEIALKYAGEIRGLSFS